MEAENIETANSSNENTNEKWEALDKTNPYAELYTSEIADISDDQKLKRQAAFVRQQEVPLIRKRAEWWFTHGEEGIEDPTLASRLSSLRETIANTPTNSNYDQRRLLYAAGAIYGLISNYNDIYTDDEVDEINKIIAERGVSCLNTPVLFALKTEASAGKNMGGGAYISVYPKNESEKSTALNGKFKRRGFTYPRAKAWKDNIENGNDEELEILTRHHAEAPDDNSWGLAEFTTECLIQDITPRGICELIQINKRVPSSEVNKFEQNRVDALALDGTVYPYHAFIHNQHPGTHELISAMVKYYDTKDDETKHQDAKKKLEQILHDRQNSTYKNSYTDFENHVFDLKNYDKQCEAADKWRGTNNPNATTVNGTAIDILRRLEKNTRPGEVDIPKTKDAELNALLDSAEIHNSKNDTENVNWKATGALVSYLNNYLVSHQGQNGLSPSQMRAIIYAERAATIAMRSISQKDWRELFYDPTFKEIVKFRELTGSYDNFSEDNFEQFWNSFTNIPIETSDSEKALQYGKLVNRINTQLSKLTKFYKESGKEDYIGDLWSGNLTHELIGLTDLPNSHKIRESADKYLFELNAN